MAKQPLAVKFRPKTFSDVTEQSAVCGILQEQLRTGSFQHSYLFCGPAGTGKTTLGRIFAHEINKGQGNPIEVDAASNSGVDNIRVIIEDSKRRAIDCEYKVFILDEVHMLSNGAFNALLKTLEESPKYSIFIMCTTNPEKIPATILSRVQRYQLSKISTDGIFNRLKYICDCENVHLTESGIESLKFISRISQGGMRDAITSLDKCLSAGEELSLEVAVKSLGNVEYDLQFDLFTYIYNHDVKNSVEIVENIFNSGKSLKVFIKQFQLFIVDICKYKVFNSFEYSQIPSMPVYAEKLNQYDKSRCIEILDIVKTFNSSIKWESDIRYSLETLLLTMENK
jgi:DNA polymerase-3 subunit gamma/tau